MAKKKQLPVSMELTREKISVDRLILRQKEGFMSISPCGYNAFEKQFERVLPASSVANLYPFNYSGKTDPNGFYNPSIYFPMAIIDLLCILPSLNIINSGFPEHSNDGKSEQLDNYN